MLCSLHWAPSCGRKTATIPQLSPSKVARAHLLCSMVLGHLSWSPTRCLAFRGLPVLQRETHGRGSLGESKVWVSSLPCEGSCLSEIKWQCGVSMFIAGWCVCVAPCPTSAGDGVTPGGCIRSGKGDVGKEAQCMCRSQNVRLRGGVAHKAWALKLEKRRHQKPGLIKTTKKEPIFSPPNSSALMFTVIKKQGLEM